MSIYSSVESLAFALHRNGYDSDNVDKVKGFVRSHRVDVLPRFLMDGHFDSYNFLSALDSVANAGDAIDSARAFQSLAAELEKAEDRITFRIIDAIDDIEADEEKVAA